MYSRKLMAPVLLYLLLFFYIPIIFILMTAVVQRTGTNVEFQWWPPTINNFIAAFDSGYIRVLLNSIKIVLIACAVCLFFTWPIVNYLQSFSRAAKTVFLIILIVPFFSSFIARMYAWFILLKPQGIFTDVFTIDLGLLNTETAIIVGLIFNYFPFVFYPVYIAREKIDPNIISAARNLGCSVLKLHTLVLIPLCASGFVTGIALMTLPALGEYVIAKMLGGGKIPLYAMMIENEFLGTVSPNWPLGSALSTILLSSVLFMLSVTKVWRPHPALGAKP